MASLAVVTQDKVRLPVARAIDNAITFMLLSISSRSVFFPSFVTSDPQPRQNFATTKILTSFVACVSVNLYILTRSHLESKWMPSKGKR